MIQVPRTMEPNKDPNIPFNLLLMSTLEWDVFYDCNQCHRRGGQCLTNWMNDFNCRHIVAYAHDLSGASLRLYMP